VPQSNEEGGKSASECLTEPCAVPHACLREPCHVPQRAMSRSTRAHVLLARAKNWMRATPSPPAVIPAVTRNRRMKAGGGGHPVLGATERVCCNSIITFGALFGSALGGPVSDALGKKIGMFAVCLRYAQGLQCCRLLVLQGWCCLIACWHFMCAASTRLLVHSQAWVSACQLPLVCARHARGGLP